MSAIFSEAICYGLERGDFYGVLYGMPSSHYHGLPAYISSSQVKTMAATSPAHYYQRYFSLDKKDLKPTATMTLGSLLHCLVLTPEEFPVDFIVQPKVDARTKEGKELRAKFEAEAMGRTVVDEETYEVAKKMALSINKKMGLEIVGAKCEVSFFWRCPLTQLKFKARADMYRDQTLFELKTTTTAKPVKFAAHAVNMGYEI